MFLILYVYCDFFPHYNVKVLFSTDYDVCFILFTDTFEGIILDLCNTIVLVLF